MSARARIPVLLFVSLLASACGKAQSSSAAMADAAAPEPPDSVRPPDDRRLPTTGGRIAFRNLEAQIQGAEAAIARSPGEITTRVELIELVGKRAMIRARIADYERALALAEALVRDAPSRPEAWIARASARSALHLFPEALGDLAEAERLGAQRAQLLTPRAAIVQGQGKLDEALDLRRAARELRRTISTLGAEAAVLGEMRRFDEAERVFAEARASFRDVSPFPLAWLFFQEGLTWERAGKTERARAFYAEALARLPMYAHAASHLALLEAPARGVSLLEPIVADADDPELALILAQRLRDRGDSAEADRRIAALRPRFEALVSAHPEAFADHAGWYFLDEGHDPQRALALAKQNLARRKTEKAYELALLAATAAGASADLCAIGTEAGSLRHGSEMLRSIAKGACEPR
jgi:tetratricopeptide (TPR) repeat protein